MARSHRSIREVHVAIEDMEFRIRREAEDNAAIISSQLNFIEDMLAARQPNLFGEGEPSPVRLFRSNRLHRVMGAATTVMGLLPSASFFIFSGPLPALSNLDGSCSGAKRTLVLIWLVFCAAICFLASFTDCSLGRDGNIYFAMITPSGLKLLSRNTGRQEAFDSYPYAFSRIDFVHSILNLLVFCAFTFTQAQVQRCIIPGKVAHSTNTMINTIPLAVAFIRAVIFHYFPRKRNGQGSSPS